MDYTIRPLAEADNAVIAQVIRNVFLELGAPTTGTAYADPVLDRLSAVYDKEKTAYFVVECKGNVIGGAGVAPLDDDATGVCELQKMYFLPEARGRGIGAELMQKCLDFARQSGYKQCYIETLDIMQAAQKLYVKSGFRYLDTPLGNTGHNSCQVWMLKEL
jgi:putative acetyltransferase